MLFVFPKLSKATLYTNSQERSSKKLLKLHQFCWELIVFLFSLLGLYFQSDYFLIGPPFSNGHGLEMLTTFKNSQYKLSSPIHTMKLGDLFCCLFLNILVFATLSESKHSHPDYRMTNVWQRNALFNRCKCSAGSIPEGQFNYWA